MRHLAATLVLCVVPAVCLAGPGPADFARAATIRVEPGGRIVKIRLPDDVYTTVTRPDLGDLRVFNAAGEVLPHTLRTVPPTTTEAEWRVVPFFAMTETQPGSVARTHVRVGSDGAVLEITGDASKTRTTTAYLVEATRLDTPLSTISLTWQTSARPPLLARVSVLASNDLNHWRTIVPSTTIAQLEHGKATLTQNEIQLPTSTERARYLQITWPRELSEAVLTSVRVRPAPTVTDVEVQWRTLPAEPTDAKSPVRFDTHALFPIEFVQVEFVDSADVVYARVLSRADPASDWTLRHEGFFYGLADPGGTVRNPPARVRRTTDRYWSLETSDEQGRRPDRMPRVRVGWYPHELVFVAGGSPPYTLAYGNAETHATKAPVDALLTVLEGDARTSQAVTATIDEPRTVAGARALKPAFSPRRIALWGILLGVVALLAILAVRVFRDSSATS